MGGSTALFVCFYNLKGRRCTVTQQQLYWNCPQSYSQCEPRPPASHCGFLADRSKHMSFDPVISTLLHFQHSFNMRGHFLLGLISAKPKVCLPSENYESMNGYYHHTTGPPTDWIILMQLPANWYLYSLIFPQMNSVLRNSWQCQGWLIKL